MGFKRLIKKGVLGGIPGLVEGHIIDAIEKKRKTGNDFKSCLKTSLKETATEDTPGLSHMYQWGHKNGKCQGTIEQAKRDEKKIQEIHQAHEADRAAWNEINKGKDEQIDFLEKHANFDK